MKKDMVQEEGLLQSSLILNRKGLNHGATGNLSCRGNNAFIITPSGINLENLDADAMVEVGINGDIINVDYSLIVMAILAECSGLILVIYDF